MTPITEDCICDRRGHSQGGVRDRGRGDGSASCRADRRRPGRDHLPRDREGGFEPQIVKKRQRRLTGVDERVLLLSAKGLTHSEISTHLAEVHGAEVSETALSTIIDAVMDGMSE